MIAVGNRQYLPISEPTLKRDKSECRVEGIGRGRKLSGRSDLDTTCLKKVATRELLSSRSPFEGSNRFRTAPIIHLTWGGDPHLHSVYVEVTLHKGQVLECVAILGGKELREKEVLSKVVVTTLELRLDQLSSALHHNLTLLGILPTGHHLKRERTHQQVRPYAKELPTSINQRIATLHSHIARL
ncbi:unknown [Porphyromonas sp. CAG:1061]|nr:unknown [Porphyromonas sp. CAG:1061]